MAADPKSNNPLDFDLPEGLEDDIGDDWETAFKAEDFMLPPDEEPENFFAKKGESHEDIDLASLLEPTEGKAKDSSSTADGTQAVGSKVPEKPEDSLLARCKNWYAFCPPYQKILFPLLAFLTVTSIPATLFFLSTTEQLTEQTTSPSQQDTAKMLTAKQPGLQVSPEETLPATPAKIRKKWPMPAFLITVEQPDNKEDLIIRVDVSLVLQLEPGQSPPEDKRSSVRDAIYQFYINRPLDELRRFPLARGEMIRKLDAWLKKESPHPPIASVIIDRYQILK